MEKVPGNRGILDGLESAVRTGSRTRRGDHGGASVDRSGDRVGDCRGDGANRDRTGGLLLTKQSVLCGTAAQASTALPCAAPASSLAVPTRLYRAKPSSGLEPETPSFERPGAPELAPNTGTQAPRNAENPRLLGGFAEAADGCRTRDLELGKLALYQLSYRRMMQGNPR